MSTPGQSGRPGRLDISVEVFPPKDEGARDRLIAGLKGLSDVPPDYVSVTYGAGGTTRERTIEIVNRVMNETPLEVAAHLTCVSASRADVDVMIHQYRDTGVKRIVALRGDPPGGFDVPYVPHPQGYQRTADLVAGIMRIGGFDISVATYPEKHPQSASLEADLDVLKAKADAGAARAITQFFFDNDVFIEFVERARARGIDLPIVAGIMPVVNFRQLSAFASKCGATVPAWLAERYDGLDEQPAERAAIGAEIAAAQIAALAEAGHRAFHIYCLNRADTVRAVLGRLGPIDRASAAA